LEVHVEGACAEAIVSRGDDEERIIRLGWHNSGSYLDVRCENGTSRGREADPPFFLEFGFADVQSTRLAMEVAYVQRKDLRSTQTGYVCQAIHSPVGVSTKRPTRRSQLRCMCENAADLVLGEDVGKP
jgi:hypothetical protein